MIIFSAVLSQSWEIRWYIGIMFIISSCHCEISAKAMRQKIVFTVGGGGSVVKYSPSELVFFFTLGDCCVCHLFTTSTWELLCTNVNMWCCFLRKFTSISYALNSCKNKVYAFCVHYNSICKYYKQMCSDHIIVSLINELWIKNHLIGYKNIDGWSASRTV